MFKIELKPQTSFSTLKTLSYSLLRVVDSLKLARSLKTWIIGNLKTNLLSVKLLVLFISVSVSILIIAG